MFEQFQKSTFVQTFWYRLMSTTVVLPLYSFSTTLYNHLGAGKSGKWNFFSFLFDIGI